MKIKTVMDWDGSGNNHSGTLRGYANPEVADNMAQFVYKKLANLMLRNGWTAKDVALCGVDNSSTAFAMAVIRRFQKVKLPLPLFFSGRKGSENECDHVIPEGDGNPRCLVFVDDDMCTGHSALPVMMLANELRVPVFSFVIKLYLNPEDISQDTLSEVESLHTNSRFYFAKALCERVYEDLLTDERMKEIDRDKYITVHDLHTVIDEVSSQMDC